MVSPQNHSAAGLFLVWARKSGADLTRSRSRRRARSKISYLTSKRREVVSVRCFLTRFRRKCPWVGLYLNFSVRNTIHGLHCNKIANINMEAVGTAKIMQTLFAWFINKKRVWTSDRLATRGCPWNDVCPLCRREPESAHHLPVVFPFYKVNVDPCCRVGRYHQLLPSNWEITHSIKDWCTSCMGNNRQGVCAAKGT